VAALRKMTALKNLDLSNDVEPLANFITTNDECVAFPECQAGVQCLFPLTFPGLCSTAGSAAAGTIAGSIFGVLVVLLLLVGVGVYRRKRQAANLPPPAEQQERNSVALVPTVIPPHAADDGWEEAQDPASGSSYLVNRKTGEFTRDIPANAGT
jgi:hypothetical protein